MQFYKLRNLKHFMKDKTFHVIISNIFILVLSEKNAFFYFVITLG